MAGKAAVKVKVADAYRTLSPYIIRCTETFCTVLVIQGCYAAQMVCINAEGLFLNINIRNVHRSIAVSSAYIVVTGYVCGKISLLIVTTVGDEMYQLVVFPENRKNTLLVGAVSNLVFVGVIAFDDIYLGYLTPKVIVYALDFGIYQS